MRKIREVLRLAFEMGLSQRKIAQSLSISCSTVCEILYRARGSELDYNKAKALDDRQLDALIYPARSGRPEKAPLDFERIHAELKRKGVTKLLLWYEYKQANPEGYEYSQFCERYGQWQKNVDPVMRQTYRAGEKMLVDWAGQTMRWIDRETGEVHEAQVFVSVLGASNYTYAEVQPSQQMQCWIEAHCNAYEFFGGVAQVLSPDNTKTGVKKADYYEPEINATYADLASHYGTVVIPSRPLKPQDHAKVESAVQAVERELLAPLRDRTFFSLAEIQAALKKQLTKLNSRPFRKMEGSRISAYETLDKPALKPLPSNRYEYAEWRNAKVNIDYHIQVENNMYSVPYQLLGAQVDVRLTSRVVEVLHNAERVASHPRSYGQGMWHTDRAHRPPGHAAYLEWTPERIVDWANSSVGAQCAALCQAILEKKVYPEQGYRSCLGVMKLAKRFGRERVEAACHMTLAIGSISYSRVKCFLEAKTDLAPIEQTESKQIGENAHLRGQAYYQEELISNAKPANAGETSETGA